MENSDSRGEYFRLKDVDETIDRVHYLDISHVEIDEHYLYIYTDKGKRYDKYCTLKSFLECVKRFGIFICASKSVVVNIRQIAKELPQDKKLRMKNGMEVLVTDKWRSDPLNDVLIIDLNTPPDPKDKGKKRP